MQVACFSAAYFRPCMDVACIKSRRWVPKVGGISVAWTHRPNLTAIFFSLRSFFIRLASTPAVWRLGTPPKIIIGLMRLRIIRGIAAVVHGSSSLSPSLRWIENGLIRWPTAASVILHCLCSMRPLHTHTHTHPKSAPEWSALLSCEQRLVRLSEKLIFIRFSQRPGHLRKCKTVVLVIV